MKKSKKFKIAIKKIYCNILWQYILITSLMLCHYITQLQHDVSYISATVALLPQPKGSVVGFQYLLKTGTNRYIIVFRYRALCLKGQTLMHNEKNRLWCFVFFVFLTCANILLLNNTTKTDSNSFFNCPQQRKLILTCRIFKLWASVSVFYFYIYFCFNFFLQRL